MSDIINHEGKTLCMNCMSELDGKEACPNCGYPANERQRGDALPFHTRLQGRYIIGREKNRNGEGITYIGYDTVLNISVAVREFYPSTLCARTEDGAAVRIIGGKEVAFDECIANFLEYSRKVAHLRELSAIVQIYDIFEENHTAYTVSEWRESISLRFFVERRGGKLLWNDARPLFMPVLSALSTLHAAGICHLGISPETLVVTQDGKMRLEGFCTTAVRCDEMELPFDVVPGCAAIEQYVKGYTPNEATDVYGFTASLFFALTGLLPQDALKRRADSRLLIPTSIIRDIPPHVVSALANGLQVAPDKRTQTFERLREELSAAPSVTSSIANTELRNMPSPYPLNAEPELPGKKKGVPRFVWAVGSCLICLAVFTLAGVIWLSTGGSFGGTESESSSAVLSELPSQLESEASEVSSTAEDTIPAPNLVGKNYDELAAETTKDYQVLAASAKEFDDTVPEGYIISQTPEAGNDMAKGTAIVVVVSKGPRNRELPDVAGKPLAEASTAVADRGFIPTKIEQYSDTIPAGSVIGYKDAQAGAQLPYGSQVVLVVSKGPNPETNTSTQG